VAQKHDVVAALLWERDNLLLVQEQGPDEVEPKWALPGGIVEAGELLTEALVREVGEETGLKVVQIGRLLYIAQFHNSVGAIRPGMALHDPGYIAVAFAFEVNAWRGEISSADPDGFILDARFVPRAEAAVLLGRAPLRVMREPIVAYLRGETSPGATWFYRRQPNGSDALVHRTGVATSSSES
jgi:8-oxo-dGTP diphosphatase